MPRCRPADQLHVTYNPTCEPAQVLSVFCTPYPNILYFPYAQVRLLRNCLACVPARLALRAPWLCRRSPRLERPLASARARR